MGLWATGTIVLDLVDPEGTGPPPGFLQLIANNLGIDPGIVPGRPGAVRPEAFLAMLKGIALFSAHSPPTCGSSAGASACST